jgi:hypothetical protein
MKKILLLPILFMLFAKINAQIGKVGINTTTPQAMLHVKDSSVLFSGPVTSATAGNPPASGAGARMMWYADKAAFRVGKVESSNSSNWDKDSIGLYSFASGLGTKAKGQSSTAMGNETSASGTVATAMGLRTDASGNYSTAMGRSTFASGTASTAMGIGTSASGTASTAMGSNTSASAFYTTAMGSNTTASGFYSTAMGAGTSASGESSTAMGESTSALGWRSTAIGYNTSASGDCSTAMSGNTSASGDYSTAMGRYTSASSDYSTAMGSSTSASGWSSTAMGNSTNALGSNSISMGYNTIAKGYASTVVGMYNDYILTSDQTAVTTTTPLFIVGNGNAFNDLSNALVVLKNGNIGINTNGSLPQAALHIKGIAPSFDAHIRLETAGAGTEYGNILYDGNMKFRTFGTGDEYQWRNAANSTTMRLNDAGNLTITGVYSPSDTRLKKNILPIQNSLQKIVQIGGYQYNWIDPLKDQDLQTGVLAQQVEKQMPELVKTNEEGTKIVNYNGLIPYLVEALKEQQQRIEKLEKEIELMKGKNKQ